jgi:hypothetical protein
MTLLNESREAAKLGEQPWSGEGSRNPTEQEVREGIVGLMSKNVYALDGVLGEGAVRAEYSRALETLARMAGDLWNQPLLDQRSVMVIRVFFERVHRG